jgi:hypothetical protein
MLNLRMFSLDYFRMNLSRNEEFTLTIPQSIQSRRRRKISNTQKQTERKERQTYRGACQNCRGKGQEEEAEQ